MKFKSFKKFVLDEAVVPFEKGYATPDILSQNFDILKPDFREKINHQLDVITSCKFITPYIALQKIAKCLAQYNMIVPRYTFAHPETGEEVFKMKTANSATGQNKDGTFSGPAERDVSNIYLFFAYALDKTGFTEIYAELVDEAGLSELQSENDFVEISESFKVGHTVRVKDSMKNHSNKTVRKYAGRSGVVHYAETDSTGKQYVDVRFRGGRSMEFMGHEVERHHGQHQTENHVIKHKKTGQVLHSADEHGKPLDYKTAKDLHSGLGADKKDYSIYKTRGSRGNLHNRSHDWRMNENTENHEISENINEAQHVREFDGVKIGDIVKYKFPGPMSAKEAKVLDIIRATNSKDGAMYKIQMVGTGKKYSTSNIIKNESLEEASKKKGFVITSLERKKHLRPEHKRQFWKKHRKAETRIAKKETDVKEENLQELSKKTLKSYVKKAKDQRAWNSVDVPRRYNTSEVPPGGNTRKDHNRSRGIIQAREKIYKARKKVKEENLQELSKKTLGRYIKKASHDVATKSAATGRYAERKNVYDKEAKNKKYGGFTQALKDDELANKFFHKSWNRRKGIAKAVDKLEAK